MSATTDALTTRPGTPGADTFVYDSVTESFVNDASGTQSIDLIAAYSYQQHDKIDVSALGFTGLGDGYHDTLSLAYDPTVGHIVVQSFEADAAGDRFVLYLDHDGSVRPLEGTDQDAFIFADGPPTAAAYNTLTGSQGFDFLYSPFANTTLVGSGGADYLVASSTLKDTFRFDAISDSYRGQSDLINYFQLSKDKLDVSALGFTGLGDGTGDTLKVVYNADTHRTYLKSFEPDADGHRFEVAFLGDLSGLAHRNFDFAKPAAEVAAHAATAVTTAEAGHTEIGVIGVAAPEHAVLG